MKVQQYSSTYTVDNGSLQIAVLIATDGPLCSCLRIHQVDTSSNRRFFRISVEQIQQIEVVKKEGGHREIDANRQTDRARREEQEVQKERGKEKEGEMGNLRQRSKRFEG